MERNFYDNDFEDILKQKADQYKMYPSDRVWNNIYSSLHGRKRWLIFGFTLLFVTSSLVIGRQVIVSNHNKVATQPNKVSQTLISPTKIAEKIAATRTNQNVHKNIFTSQVRLKPEENNLAAVPKQNTNSIAEATVTIPADAINSNNNVSVSATDAEAQPLVIENNLLPAITEKHSVVSSKATTSAEKEKSIAAGKSIAEKTTTPVKENKPASAIQNNIKAVTPVKDSKWYVQLYASPIISYRRLSNQNQPDYTPPVSATYAGNINKYVHHQPAPGLEVGGKVIYKLSNSLSVYAGAQLNYSRYYIDAYKYRIEKASIALNDSRSVSGYTDIRNFSGFEPEQLQNQYWQLSVPIGIEIKLLGQKKLQFNVAGGFQPTVLINSNSYLLSSDYKNYIQSPDLARSFNVHTNFEAFVSYKTGGYKLQLGPQFRSQLLSSYSNQYRVREYLTEFGIKFGITKTLR